MSFKKLLFTLFILALQLQGLSQSNLSGSLEASHKIFMRDSAIGAYGLPVYDNLLSGTEAWLTVNYSNVEWKLNAGIRLDLYNNSNLIDPTGAYSKIGIGRWYVDKEIGKLLISGGYLYEQFGSGITFRTYEERSLAIDNALFGVLAKYQINKNWWIKGITGQMKNRFSLYEPIIKGVNLEGYQKISKKASMAPGFSFVNRTLDQQNMDIIVSTIESYPGAQRFVPRYNVYAYSIYNRLDFGAFSWYFELAAKSHEAIANRDGLLEDRPGTVYYTSIDYSQKGLGLSLQYKRVHHFELRTSPNETLNNGLITFIPPTSRSNTYTLTSRYNPASQLLGEEGLRFDFYKKIRKNMDLKINMSRVADAGRHLLYRELYAEFTYRQGHKWKLLGGLQVVDYNQIVYEQKGDSLLRSLVPFIDFLYRINRRKSLRAELQYMANKEDFGSWVFALIEFNLAPRWSFSVSDMYNFKPKKTPEPLHYPTVFASYRHGGNRFTLSYAKQVEGIVCTGGVCRFEPAFSGVRFTVSSTF